MNSNIVYIPTKISKIKLREVLHGIYTNYENSKIDLDGITITLKRLPDDIPTELCLSGKQLQVKLPVSFELYKNAGLFSLEGEGCILLDFRIQIDILQNLEIRTHTTWESHQWIKGPVVHIGELSIPAEKISNCIINFLKEDIAKKIDQTISENLRLNDLIEQQLKQYAHNIKINEKPLLFFNGRIINIFLGSPQENDQNIEVEIWLELLVKISDTTVNYEFQSNINLFWAELAPDSNQHSFEVEFSYLGLSKIMAAAINGKEFGGKKFEVESIHIRKTQNLEIKAHLITPVKGILTILSKPRFDIDTQELHFDNLILDVNAENFIYRMVSPVIENIIKSRIEENMPINMKPILTSIIKNIPEIKILNNFVRAVPSFEKPQINSFLLGQNSLQLDVKLQNPEVSIQMQ